MRKSLVSAFCLVAAISAISVISLSGCNKAVNKNSNSGASPTSATQPASAETGVEKVKPAAGTGNVQGKVLFNSKPTENIEVKLCEKFNRFIGGCNGQTYLARTDKDGEYVITNVPPKEYEGLLARVFETDSFIFATTGLAGISANKYNVTADKTLFVSPTNLYKGDLKILNPKAGSKVSAENLELKWDAYPDAAYYKFSIHAEEATVTSPSPYINERVDGTSFSVDKPLEKGTYRWRVDAFNSSDKKLAESSDDIKFTIN